MMDNDKSTDDETFEITEDQRDEVGRCLYQIRDISSDCVKKLLVSGIEIDKASSVVANLLISTAWTTASSGAKVSGRTPDPERFRRRADEVTRPIVTKWVFTEDGT